MLGTWTKCFKIARTIIIREGFESCTGGARWEVMTCNEWKDQCN